MKSSVCNENLREIPSDNRRLSSDLSINRMEKKHGHTIVKCYVVEFRNRYGGLK